MQNNKPYIVVALILAFILVIGITFFVTKKTYEGEQYVEPKKEAPATTTVSFIPDTGVYSNSKYGFEFKPGKGWALEIDSFENMDLQEKVTIANASNYRMTIYISKSPDAAQEPAQLETVPVLTMIDAKLTRYLNPKFDEGSNRGGYFALLSETEGGYSRSFKHGDYYYSIYYYTPTNIKTPNSYDRAAIKALDKVVGTFRFK